ncbi:MAG: alpha/beta hydrolase [Rhodobacteraceae bacterium]|nr:alpha/beta hydrolase [Paracoccaceae bacterium]
MPDAPLYAEHAEAPPQGQACWLDAADGTRLRAAFWRRGDKGTVLLFPGRTEFIEKYGRTAADFAARGYAMACIDWRGQGLSDRLAPNRKLGHVEHFQDYQTDVDALIKLVRANGLPEPYFICAHSMGGAIALRALLNGADIKRTVMTAPMWGLNIEPLWRGLAQAVAAGTRIVGLGQEFAPGTGPLNYLESHEFMDNSLTSSAEGWEYMTRLVKAHPGLEIGGPSIQWLYEALVETRDLMASTPPEHEMLCMIGSDEKVVDKRDVLAYAERWTHGQVAIVTGARHEILMESQEIRKRAHDMIDAFFSG